MEISFADNKLAKICNSEKQMLRKFGKPIAERIGQRLNELKAAETLADMRNLPGARCHELKGDRAGCFAVDLVHPHRLVFFPDHDPRPELPDGGLDWDKVSKIMIKEIVDYH